VGKTSVLEALLVEPYAAKFYNELLYCLERGRNIDVQMKTSILDFYQNKSGENNLLNTKLPMIFNSHYIGGEWEKVSIYIGFQSYPEFKAEFSNNNPINEGRPDYKYAEQIQYVSRLIFTSNIYSSSVSNIFSEQIYRSNSKKQVFINTLKILMPDISDIYPDSFQTSSKILYVRQSSRMDSAIPMQLIGDGSVKLLNYLIYITFFSHFKSRIMIDEMDSGIHYSRLKDFWKTILHSAMQNDVQLFMTTHSEECIKYYKMALEELGEEYRDQARIIELNELTDKSIKSITHTYHDFARSIELENEIRGGY